MYIFYQTYVFRSNECITRSGILGCIARYLSIAFEKLPNLFPNLLHHSTLIPAKYKGANFSTLSPALVLVFLIRVILVDVMWYPTVVLI